MKTPAAHEIRRHLLSGFATTLESRGLSVDDVPDDYDLLYEGIIDSLGLLEMIADIEGRFGLQIDFERLDAENLTIVGPFCRFVAAEAALAAGLGASARIGAPGWASGAEEHIPDAVRWVLEAAGPYYEWLFGDADEAMRVLSTWMRRPSSEVYIGRAALLLEQGQAIGGFIAMGGDELGRCRKSDTLAAVSDTAAATREQLRQRMEVVRGLFSLAEPNEFYLSKLGVAEGRRGQGFGSRLLDSYVAAGRKAGYARFRLDVHAENNSAIRLYRSRGFRTAGKSVAADARISYMTMTMERAS